MENLSNRVRGLDYDENEDHKVMSRLQWLNHLSLMFNISLGVASISPSSSTSTTEALLNNLIENFAFLPLKTIPEYLSLNSAKFISFKEIFKLFEGEFGRFLSWDNIMEKVMSLDNLSSTQQNDREKHCSLDLNELVYISKITSSSIEAEPQHHKRISDLRIPNNPAESISLESASKAVSRKTNIEAAGRKAAVGETLNTFLDLMEFEDGMSPESAKIIESPNMLPLGIICLNLSRCKLTKIPHFERLEFMEYLDLSWNFIKSLKGCAMFSRIQELYLSHNRVSELNSLESCSELRLLDVSYNKILHFSSIIGLKSLLDLRIFNLEVNQVINQIGFKQNFQSVFNKILVINPRMVPSYSNYKAYTKISLKPLKEE